MCQYQCHILKLSPEKDVCNIPIIESLNESTFSVFVSVGKFNSTIFVPASVLFQLTGNEYSSVV